MPDVRCQMLIRAGMIKVRARQGQDKKYMGRHDECYECERFFSPEWVIDRIMCETKIGHEELGDG